MRSSAKTKARRFPLSDGVAITLTAVIFILRPITVDRHDDSRRNAAGCRRTGRSGWRPGFCTRREHRARRPHRPRRSHQYEIFLPTGGMDNVRPPSGEAGQAITPGPSYFYETPASLGCVYRLTSVSSAQIGCNPTDLTLPNPSGGAKAIAIVDAYDYPTAFSDLQTFSAQFGLPAPTTANFQVVDATGTAPKADAGWGLESALDIQWAHEMAPQAKIYIVEAADKSCVD